MEAVITIKDGFSNITLKDIKQALGVKGIKYGRYPDAILQCNLDQNNKKFIAAKQDSKNSFHMVRQEGDL